MKIFVTGAGGLIGGAVASQLSKSGHVIRGLIRDPGKVTALRGKGVIPVVGTLAADALLKREAQAADAVINAADADHRPAVDVLISALTGTGKLMIQTSGVSIFCDEARGEPSERLFDDAKPFTPLFRAERWEMDKRVLAAPGVRSVVVSPALVYGQPLTAPVNSQLQILYADARATGTAHFLGRGRNRWSVVHIEDLVDLYQLLLEAAPAATLAFAENGEAAYSAIAQAMADNLQLGHAESISVESAKEKWGHVMAVYGFGSNCRVRASRARALGWKPRHASFLDWIRSQPNPGRG